VVEPFLKVVRTVSLRAPEKKIVSTVTGEIMTATEATDPQYWANHLRSTVKFSPALFRTIELGGNVFIEVGPRTTLSSLAVQHFAKAAKNDGERIAIAMLSDNPEPQSELGGIGTALAKLWCAGIELDWQRIWPGGKKVPLVSTYPFERKDYRFSEGRHAERRTAAQSSVVEMQPAAATNTVQTHVAGLSVEDRLMAELGALLSERSGFGVEQLEASFVECGFDSLLLMQIGVELGKRYGVAVSLRDLMEKVNTPKKLSGHIFATAAPECLRHLNVAAAPVEEMAAPVRSGHAPVEASIAGPQFAPSIAFSTDGSGAARERLIAVRNFIDQQLRQIGATAASAPAEQAEATHTSAPSGELRNTRATQPSGKPLIRAKHSQPPAPGAFRVAGTAGNEKWLVFDANSRRYCRVKQ
jgi:acyl carrier protein